MILLCKVFERVKWYRITIDDEGEEIRRISLEWICPICSQKFTNIEEHVSKAHAGGLDVGFVKWVMRIDKDLEKIKRMEIFRGIF